MVFSREDANKQVQTMYKGNRDALISLIDVFLSKGELEFKITGDYNSITVEFVIAKYRAAGWIVTYINKGRINGPNPTYSFKFSL